jgi:hypothetical protein
MTTTLGPAPVANTPSRTPTTRLPGGPRRRRPLLVLVSAVVVFTSVVGFASLYSSANHQVAVLYATQTIQLGQKFVAGQLGQTDAALSGDVSAIPVADASELAGARAAVTIPAGSLLTTADLTDSSPIGNGDAVVGLALKAGQLPAEGVEPGDQVMIVQTAAPGAAISSPSSATSDNSSASGGSSSSADGSSGTGVLVPQALVSGVENPSSTSSSDIDQLVSVEVSSTVAPAVSTAANAGQISLVLLPNQGNGQGGAA